MILFLGMNFLAHAVLSFNKPGILSGNMISDFVKGKAKFNYPLEIQKGIQLHRFIDSYTDAHPVTTLAKKYFRAQYHLYAGAFVDIIYDHFLALDLTQFEESNGLENFTKNVYILLDKNIFYFPQQFQSMLPYMKEQNWLYNYRLKEGIKKSFGGLVRRAVYLHECEIAFQIFNENYEELKNCYYEFFPQVKKYAHVTLLDLIAG